MAKAMGGWRRHDSPASQAGFRLLVCSQSAHIDRRLPVELVEVSAHALLGSFEKRVVTRPDPATMPLS